MIRNFWINSGLIALIICSALFGCGCLEAVQKDSKNERVQELYNQYEKDSIQRGWQKITLTINGSERKILWLAPEGPWENGAIIALHGGGGTYSNFGSNLRIGEPMIAFSDLAVKEGFAIFSLDSTDELMDEQGNPMGKRWDSLAKDDSANTDLPFIENVIVELIPTLRPPNSSCDIFMTGISNGGYMTILAATHFDDKITAFAPVSCGDPYGTYMEGGVESPFRETPGIFRDSETNLPINVTNACRSESYANEKIWVTSNPNTYPSFKLFYHEGDGVCDISCKEKLENLLVQHGYRNDGSFIVKDVGIRSPLKHLWVDQYNEPLIDFFKRSADATGEKNCV